MENRHLPAGLLDSNTELFSDNEGNSYKLVNSTVVNFDLFDTELYEALESAMLSNSAIHQGIIEMVGDAGRRTEVKQYAYCCHGGFDDRPDFINGQLTQPEYWPCSKRGNCRFEGRICKLRTPTGEVLTKREIEYTVMTAQGMFDKEIASEMGISPNTITTHSKNVRVKTGLSRKADLTRFAIENNLLKSGASFLNVPESV
jgi:DNA-binding CsgD family transcriptional regulator